MKTINYIALSLGDKFLGTNVIKWYKEIKAMQHWSKEEIVNWQNRKFKLLVKHAYDNVIFYKALFDKSKLNPKDFSDISQISVLPIITKKIIKENFERLNAKNKNEYLHKRSATGGSTAEPLIFFRDYNSWSFTTALSMIYWEKLGYKLGDKFAAFGSSNIIPNKKLSIKHKLFYKLKGKISLEGINFNEEVIMNHITVIKKQKVEFLYGYSSALYLLAKFILETKVDIKIKGCISTSELLLHEYRDTIEKAFNCKILDAYGAGDGGITAFNYDGNYFEVGYNSIIEIDKKENRRILTTDLLNFSMPFIRYEVGDSAEENEENFKKFNGQTLGKLYGRVPNVLKFNNGKELIAPAFTVLFSDVNVDAYRFIKIDDDVLKIEIKKSDYYTSDNEITILNALKNHIGSEIKIIIDYKQDFEFQNSGKRNYFITK